MNSTNPKPTALNPHSHERGTTMKKVATALYAVALLAGPTGSLTLAQNASTSPKPAEDTTAIKPAPAPMSRCAEEAASPQRTFYLNHAVQQADANEVLSAERNLLDPCDKIYLVNSQNAIVVRAGAENMALFQKVLNELDQPKRTYRLTYTVTEVDAGKRVGTQHFVMVTASGQNTKLKQGSKVPIATGSYNAAATTGDSPRPAGVQTQYTYIDVGMSFDVTLTAQGDGASLKSLVDQSSLAPETSGLGAQDPIVRQTELAGVFYLTNGKPLVIGSLDIPGTTRRLDIEVLMEPLP
jgi:type II secretory pathway component GspD/PulD (secretin)